MTADMIAEPRKAATGYEIEAGVTGRVRWYNVDRGTDTSSQMTARGM